MTSYVASVTFVFAVRLFTLHQTEISIQHESSPSAPDNPQLPRTADSKSSQWREMQSDVAEVRTIH